MFFLKIGLFWISVIAILTFAFYSGSPDRLVYLYGVPSTHAEFTALLWPKLIFGLFWLIGLIFLFVGLKIVITDLLTKYFGKEVVGCVVDITPSGYYENNKPSYNAEILIKDFNGNYTSFLEDIGFNSKLYPKGSYVKVKYYKKDINLLGLIDDESDIPVVLREYIKEKYPILDIEDNIEFENDDLVVIDGV